MGARLTIRKRRLGNIAGRSLCHGSNPCEAAIPIYLIISNLRSKSLYPKTGQMSANAKTVLFPKEEAEGSGDLPVKG